MSPEPTSTDPRRIGKNIAAARIKQRLTQHQLAERLGVSRQTIIALEGGQRRPASDLLVRIAEALQASVRDLVALVPSMELAGVRFRTMELQPEVAAAVEVLEEFGRRYATLEEHARQRLHRVAPPAVEIPANRDVVKLGEEIAANARRVLALGEGPLMDLRTVLEDQVGLRIFGIDELRSTKVDGLFACSEELGPLVGFNPAFDSRRIVWTLCHEYAHFLTNRFGAEVTLEGGRGREEHFANAFTAAFLMPPMGISKRFSDLLEDVGGELTVSHLVLLSDEYSVSFEALVRRLEELERIKRGTLQHLRDSGFKPLAAERELGIDRHTEKIESWPRRYTYLLALLVERGEIAEGEAARYLRRDRLETREVLQRYEVLLTGTSGADPSLKGAVLC